VKSPPERYPFVVAGTLPDGFDVEGGGLIIDYRRPQEPGCGG
jgi:hypothetical protein